MSCKCAKRTDEYYGWECEVTGGECMFLFPNSKRCAEIYGEGPDAEEVSCCDITENTNEYIDDDSIFDIKEDDDYLEENDVENGFIEPFIK